MKRGRQDLGAFGSYAEAARYAYAMADRLSGEARRLWNAWGAKCQRADAGDLGAAELLVLRAEIRTWLALPLEAPAAQRELLPV